MEFMVKSTKAPEFNQIVASKRIVANLNEITTIIDTIEWFLFGDKYAVSEENEADSNLNLDCITGRIEAAVAETIQIIKRLSQLRDRISIL